MNSSNIIVYLYDVQKKEGVYANNALEKLLGYTNEDIRHFGGGFYFNVMHPDDINKFEDYLENKIMPLHDKEIAELEYRMKRKNGHYLWFRSHDWCV